MSKIKFYIHSPGDNSVGICDLNSEVEINDNAIWDESMINDTKRLFSELYDTNFDLVLTRREYLIKAIEAEQQEIQMLQMEIADESNDHTNLISRIEACRSEIKICELELSDSTLL